MTPHPLTNFEIQTYYQNQPRFIGVYSRNNLPYKIKYGAYVINLDDYSDIGSHWIALFVNNKTVAYFDSFGIEHIPKKVKKFMGNRNIISNIYRIQNYDSVMCGYFCIGFINYMFKGKSLTDYNNFFSPNNFKKNDDISDCNWTRTHNHLVHKRTLNHLAKLALSHLFRARSSLTFRQI